MTNTRRQLWQYSLSALMGAVAVIALICRIAGLIGLSSVLAIAPIAWVFWVIYRLIDRMIKSDNRNSNTNQSNYTRPGPYF